MSNQDTFREVAQLLFGDGADELVSKLSQTPEAKDRRKRATTAGLSTVGAAAGLGGMGYSGVKVRSATKTALNEGKALKPALKAGIKSEKGAALLFPLEVAGLGGEVMSTKILHGDVTKKPKQPVIKSEPCASDVHLPTTGRMKMKLARGAIKQVNENPRIQAKKTEVGHRVKEKFGKSFTWEGEFSKVDEDKRQVFGWASITEMGGEPVYDLQGDYIDTDEIEKSAYDYVIKSRKGGDMHRRNADDTPVHSSDMIESFMVTPEKIAKMGLPEGSLPTGWWVGFQVNDDDAWNLVKSGKRTAFSIHGRGQRTPWES